MGLGESLMIQGFGLIWVFYGLLWFLPVAYLILRWRAYREPGPVDSQLGIKAALYYFKSMAYHVLLVGGVCLLYGLLSDLQREFMLRLAAALFVSGGLIYGSHTLIILKKTNTANYPAVARLFNGFNLGVAGLAAMGALVAFFVLLFAPDDAGDVMKVVVSVLLVYVGAWVAQVVLLLQRN